MLSRKFSFLALFLLLVSCSKVPITNRKQVNMLPETTLIGMSVSNYREFLSKNPAVNATAADAQLVKKVGQNMSSAVSKFMREKHLTKRIRDYKWEFNLVNKNEVNAWCMPGGKVVVYSGLLPLTQNESALAAVMGHEIAHAVARHGNERMSQLLLVNVGAIGLAVALSQKPSETNQLFFAAYGVGSTLGVLKYSRVHESEADKMGLVFMAMAGYNPTEAVAFWERMAKQGGPKMPELLSTHPSDETRIKDIKAFLPTAMNYYKK